MSKKLKNYPDPSEVMEKYGADAMRFYMLSSSVVQADNLSFSEKGVDEIVKKNISRLYNVLAFYQLYADGTSALNSSKNILDAWILSRLNNLIKITTEGYESYRVDLATRPLTDFIDDFSVWYLRRSRDRFKEQGSGKKDALATLRYVLHTISRVIAPAMPFFAEEIYQALKIDGEPESVHLCDWPKADKKKISEDLEEKMKLVRDVVNLALAERIVAGIKVKQPLAKILIKNTKSKIKNDKDLLELIKDEVNIKEIIFDEKISKEVELDVNLTKELKQEGAVREIIRFAQDARKTAELNPSDRILAYFFGDEELLSVIKNNKDNISKEIGAKEILFENAEGQQKEILIGGKKLALTIKINGD